MSQADEYIPNAREAVIGYFGGNHNNACRERCVKCSDVEPLTDPRPVYGGYSDDEVPYECDHCGISFGTLSAMCQAEHDEQQARWARESRVEYVIEMGATAAIRCRVY